MTQAERADALGISPRQLRRDEERGCPKDLEGARAWRTRTVPQAAAPGDLNGETTRLRKAQADKEELEVAERRGELAPVVDFQIAFNEVMVIVAGQLDGLPGRMAAQLAGVSDAAEIRQLLLNETRRIRGSAAARIEDWARGVAVGEPVEAAAGPDTGPVGRPKQNPSARKRGAGAVAKR